MSKHHMEKVTCPFCHHEGVDIDNMYEFASSHCDDFKDLRDDEDIVINREWSPNPLANNIHTNVRQTNQPSLD